MTDVNKAVDTAKADAVKAYGLWNKVGAWVASHPKTAVAVAVAVVVAVVVVAIAV